MGQPSKSPFDVKIKFNFFLSDLKRQQGDGVGPDSQAFRASDRGDVLLLRADSLRGANP